MNTKRKLYVVIHAVASELSGGNHASEQARIAHENGADGVFLIPDYAKGRHIQASSQEILDYYKALNGELLNFKIGINFLGPLSGVSERLYRMAPSMLQVDGERIEGLDRTRLPITKTFCGVAFKYSPFETLTGKGLRDHCVAVASRCDIPTTSGSATGVAANIAKVEEIVSYLPDRRIGIASGVTLHNAAQYSQLGVTDFLVATSLLEHIDGQSRDILGPQKVRELADILHSA